MSSTRSSVGRLVVCLFILVNAVACETAAGTLTPPSEEVAEIPSGEEKVVITFAGWESDRQFYEPLIAEFHKQNPEIVVQIAALPRYVGGVDAYYRRLASAGDTILVGGNVPTSVAHYFLDLQPLTESDATFEPDDFWPGAMDACRDSEGRLLGIPVIIGFQGIFYDDEVFEAAAVPSPQPGWTWDDFRTAVRPLAKQDGEAIRYGYVESSGPLMSPLIAAGVEAAWGEIDIERLQPLIQWYLDLVRERAIDPIYLGFDDEAGLGQNWEQWEDWQNMFQSENRPAMWDWQSGRANAGG